MKSLAICCLLSFALLITPLTSSGAPEECERTTASSTEIVETWPQADSWFGSKALAVILPHNGIWPTTSPGHSISVKLFWWREGFEPGSEANLLVQIERLDEGLNDAEISSPTNAGGESLGAWTMLTGINFPSAGCWEVTGKYLDDKLTFIVETVELDTYRRDAT